MCTIYITIRLEMYSTYILQDLYYIYYKTYTMKLMLHIYYDVHVYDKTNIYTFRHTVHYIYYKTYTMRLILYILNKVRISASQIAKRFWKLQKSAKRFFWELRSWLYYVVSHYTTLWDVTLRCKTLHYVVRRYSTL